MQRQYRDVGDDRNKGFCIHCGGPYETDDHNPSKVFLDEPLPPNLPVSQSCLVCNNGFSTDEEYVSCLIECTIAGRADPEALRREKICRALSNNRRLLDTLRAARKEEGGRTTWVPDSDRVERIVIKLARGLVAYELNEPQLDTPDVVDIGPLVQMDSEVRRVFESGGPNVLSAWPEVGSRALTRLLEGRDDEYTNGWLVVQDRRFRYRVDQDEGACVRMVIRDYLACTVAWS